MHFLMRDCNKGFVEVTGRKVNRGAGYGLEIPCIYRLYGPKPYTDRIQDIVTTLQRNGMYIKIFQLRLQNPAPCPL